MRDFSIRDAASADLPALRALFLASRGASFFWEAPDSLALDDFDRATAEEPILVATIGEEVVGFASWWPPENFVRNLFVAPNRARRGIGRALLDATLARIGRPARLKCDRRNAAALAFYASRGWRVDDERLDGSETWLPLIFD